MRFEYRMKQGWVGLALLWCSSSAEARMAIDPAEMEMPPDDDICWAYMRGMNCGGVEPEPVEPLPEEGKDWFPDYDGPFLLTPLNAKEYAERRLKELIRNIEEDCNEKYGPDQARVKECVFLTGRELADLNDDGEFSREEIVKFIQRVLDKEWPGGPGADRVLNDYDKNNDGKLTDDPTDPSKREIERFLEDQWRKSR